MKRLFSLLFLLACLLLPQRVLAANYGEGIYGDALYNEGAAPTNPSTSDSPASGSSSPSSPSAPSCTAQKPSSVPDLFQINAKSDSVTIFFAPVSGNTDRYFVSYSTNENAEEHGFEFESQSTGVVAVNINHLSKNTTYYFKVRAGNGCQPGDWSNILSIRSGQRFPSYRWASLPRVVTTAVKSRTNPSAIERVVDNRAQEPDFQPEAPQAIEESESQIQAPSATTPTVRTPQPAAPVKQESASLLDRFVRLVLKVIGR